MTEESFVTRLTNEAELHPVGTPWVVGDVLLMHLDATEDVPPYWTLVGGDPRTVYRTAWESGGGSRRIFVAKQRH